MVRYYKKKSHSADVDSLEISKYELIPNKKYFLTVVAITDDLNDDTMLAYNPTQIMIIEDEINVIMIIIPIIIVVILLIVLYFIYRKYRITKLRLDYEVSDIRNLANIPKSDSEMKIVHAMREKEKYTNLTESNN